MNTIPQVGDTIHFSPRRGETIKMTISSIHLESENVYADNDTVCYFFEDLDATETPNAWHLNWK